MALGSGTVCRDNDASAVKSKSQPHNEKKTGKLKQSVRLMAPFAMHCLACHHFIYRNTKFNARKTDTHDTYLGVRIWAFNIRCPHCGGEIVFRTDPQSGSYACVSGADRNLDPWRDKIAEQETTEARLSRLAAQEKKKDKLSELDESLKDAKKEADRDREIALLQKAASQLQHRQSHSLSTPDANKSSSQNSGEGKVMQPPRFKLPIPKRRKGLQKQS